MGPPPGPNRVVFELKLHFGRGAITVSAPVPDVEMRVADFLPVMYGLQDAISVGVAKDAEGAGRPVSCSLGCAACCRQPVPVSESEAVRLAEVVEGLPPDHRSRIRARFRETLAALKGSGLLERVRAMPSVAREERMEIGAEYVRGWIACPFLEDEACSIYADRPLRCREFMVTSPPENCAEPRPDNIERPPTPPGPWPLVYRFEDGRGEDEVRWVPLVLALEFAAERAATPLPTYSAPAMFQEMLARLSARDLTKGDQLGP